MIIGLSGYAGAGKDAVGRILTDACGYTRVSFAGPLYEALYRLNPLIPTPHRNNGTTTRLQHLVKEIGWDATKRAHPEARELLQRVGTEVGRDLFGTDFWVNMAMREADSHENVVITDVRFVNEMQAVQNDDRNEVWRIVRPGVGPVNGHVSDTALTDTMSYDQIVHNNGTLQDLRRTVLALLP